MGGGGALESRKKTFSSLRPRTFEFDSGVVSPFRNQLSFRKWTRRSIFMLFHALAQAKTHTARHRLKYRVLNEI